jgi:hypothetical protein
VGQIEGKPVYRVLRKPFDMTEIISTVRECIGKKPSNE